MFRIRANCIMTGNDNGKIINKAVVCVTMPHFQGSMILLSFGLLGCAFGNTICHQRKADGEQNLTRLFVSSRNFLIELLSHFRYPNVWQRKSKRVQSWQVVFVESNLWRFPNFKRQLISMFCPSVFSLKIAMLNDIGKGAVTYDRKRQACTK